MQRRHLGFLLIVALWACPASAVGNTGPDSLVIAKRTATIHLASVQAWPEGERSIPLAGALSAVLPGAGQVYNQNWIKAGVAVGIEILLISGRAVWQSRGRDGERAFQAYAHEHWSPVRYAQWLNRYSGYVGPDILIPDLSNEVLQNPGSWTAEQETQVMNLFDQIRAAENQSIHVHTSAAFSHILPYFAEQQYYELIGKYFQYGPGWVDYGGADNPDLTDENGRPINIPSDSRFFDYADRHARANDYLRSASRVSSLFILNHFLSAIDAAVSAKLHNQRLDTSVSVTTTPSGDVMTQGSITFTF